MNQITSPFAALAARQIPSPVQKRRAAAQKRALAKLAEDKAKLGKLWRKWRRERFDAVIAGPYGDAARELVATLETLTLEHGDELVATIAVGPWTTAPAATRSALLSAIDMALVTARERAGLALFSDPLPGMPPDSFQAIRKLLTPEETYDLDPRP
jgi:hypothetical protein